MELAALNHFELRKMSLVASVLHLSESPGGFPDQLGVFCLPACEAGLIEKTESSRWGDAGCL